MDNIATYVCNSDAMPSIAVPTNATNSVNDTMTGSTTPTFKAKAFTPWIVNIGGTRQFQENWTLRPVIEPDRLARLRCAFQIVVGAYDPCSCIISDDSCINCAAQLSKLHLLPRPPEKPIAPVRPVEPIAVPDQYVPSDPAVKSERIKSHFLKKNELYTSQMTDYEIANIEYLKAMTEYHLEVGKYCQAATHQLECNFPRGWYGIVEKRCDVPKEACYTSKACCGRFVYVTPNCVDALNRFTFTVLKIASTDPPGPSATVVRSYDANNVVTETKVTTQEDFEATHHAKQASGAASHILDSTGVRQNSLPPLRLRSDPVRDQYDGSSGIRGLIQLNNK